MGKNILITGGAGFIGLKLAYALKSEGHRVTILDNLSPQIHGDISRKQVWLKTLCESFDFIQGNILDRKTVEKCILGKEIVFHFAAETGTGQSMYEIEKYCNVNVTGTAVLLECLINSNVKQFILASSRSVYGEGKYESNKYGIVYPRTREVSDLEKGYYEPKYKDDYELKAIPTDEGSKVNPMSIYASTKLAQENLVQNICNSLDISSIIFRFQNVYGPGQSLNNPYTGILSIFSKRIRHGKKIMVFEDGKESRDFIYIDDLIEILVRSINIKTSRSEIVNVGTGIGTTILEVATILKEIYDSNVPITVTGNYRLGDIRHNFADLNKLKKLLKVVPQTTFKEGVILFAEWVKNQELEDDNLEKSLKELKEKGLLI